MAKEQQLADIHSLALRRYDYIYGALRDERAQCLEDRRFYSIAGAQWEGKLGEQFVNKPKFEVNKIHLAVIRIINEYRNNRITVDFISKDGSKNDDLADTCDGLYRADEQDSVADEAFDNAFEEAVGGGFGAWRLRACKEDEDDEENEHQRIRFEPIYDADSSVWFDLDSKRQDKSDAKFCFVISSMTHEAFKDEYKKDPTSFDKGLLNGNLFDWVTAEVVYIAEYYVKEEIKEKVNIYRFPDGTEEKHCVEDLKEDPEIQRALDAFGARLIREKTVEKCKVHKYILSGAEVLEDCGYIAGRHIPIVPVYGKRWFVDNKERCMGHVRLTKDAQRLKNMMMSKLGEISASSATEKPILAPQQILGFEHLWAQDNVENYPYLLANPLKDANDNVLATGPMSYTKPPSIPQSLAALMQSSEQDIKDLLGNPEQGEKIVSNISAEAIDSVQNQIGQQTYIYMSNMAKAVRRSGEIWLSMARELYIEEGRTMKVVGRQNEVDSVELSRPIDMGEGVEYENDLTKASFDLAVTVGPTSSSKRNATIKALTAMLPLVSPDDQPIISSMIMYNMDGEGIQDVRDYYRGKLLRQGVMQPTEEEQKQIMAEMQNQPPDPNTQYLQAAAAEAEAKAQKAKADTVLVITKAEETRAKTAETIAKMSRDERQEMMMLLQQIDQEQMAAAQPNMGEGIQNEP